MARRLFEEQAIRRRNGQLANSVTLVAYTDEAGTVLANVAATSGGSAIAGSTVTTADIAGLGPASLRFWGPSDATDTLYLRVPADASLGVQKIEADPDPRLDALEAGGGGGGVSAEIIADNPAGGGTDDASALQTKATAAGAGRLKLRADKTYRVASALTIPAGCILDLNGSVVTVADDGHLATGGVGVSIRNGTLDFSADGGLLGGEKAVLVGHARALVDGVRFLGNGFRYGVLIQHASGGSCDDSEIAHCRFEATSYAVFKQGSGGTTANRLKIRHSYFSAIARGDAVELNIGDDVGYQIHHNEIDTVTADGVGQAGFGIGIAGGSYGGAAADQARQFSITDNRVRNCEAGAIHVEACNAYLIARNRLVQEGAYLGSVKAIESFGNVGGTIEDNEIVAFYNGIYDEQGFTAGDYVASTDASVIRRNRVVDCSEGIYSGVAGDLKWVAIDDNILTGCAAGILQAGAAIIRIRRNTISDSANPVIINLNPGSKATVNGTWSRFLEIIGNRAFKKGVAQTGDNLYSNFTYDQLIEADNNFPVAAVPSHPRLFTDTDPRTYHSVGDVIIYTSGSSDQTYLVCTGAGSQQALAGSYFYHATALDDFLVIDAPGDPSLAFKVGQRIRVAGIGVAGATVDTYITRFSIPGEYRVHLADSVVTTQGAGPSLSLPQTSTFLTLYRSRVEAGVLPTAAVAERGRLLYVAGGAGVADVVSVCLKSAADTYSWKTVATG